MPLKDYNLGFDQGEEDRQNNKEKTEVSEKSEAYKRGYEHGYTAWIQV